MMGESRGPSSLPTRVPNLPLPRPSKRALTLVLAALLAWPWGGVLAALDVSPGAGVAPDLGSSTGPHRHPKPWSRLQVESPPDFDDEADDGLNGQAATLAWAVPEPGGLGAAITPDRPLAPAAPRGRAGPVPPPPLRC